MEHFDHADRDPKRPLIWAVLFLLFMALLMRGIDIAARTIWADAMQARQTSEQVISPEMQPSTSSVRNEAKEAALTTSNTELALEI